VLLADLLRTALREQDSLSLRQLLDTGTAAIQAPTLGALLAYTHRHPHAQWTSRSDLPDAVARAAASDDMAVCAFARDLAHILPTPFAHLSTPRSVVDASSADLQRYQDVCSATADWWVHCLDNQAAVARWSFRDLTTEQLATFRAVLMARLPAAVHAGGYMGVVLRSDYGPQGVLKDAADAAGILAVEWPDKAETETTPTSVQAWRDRNPTSKHVYQHVRWRDTDLGPACSVPDLAYLFRLSDPKPLYARVRAKEIPATHLGDRLYVPRAWLAAHYPEALHRAGAIQGNGELPRSPDNLSR
jgi:hypothetical protein